jgi:hypothetical protein
MPWCDQSWPVVAGKICPKTSERVIVPSMSETIIRSVNFQKKILLESVQAPYTLEIAIYSMKFSPGLKFRAFNYSEERNIFFGPGSSGH